jgi:hypothetical protein
MIDDAHRPAGHPPSGVPSGVINRMERLRLLCVPERDAEARRRLADRPRITNAPFAAAVARRLAELRALCDLASHLRRR